jgi:cystathionine gamma-synthase
MEATPRDAVADAVDGQRFETRAIHAGQEPEALYGSVNVPIYQTATYAQDGVGRPKRWDYGRGGNPTREAFQVALAALEGGTHGFAFASGMAAETTLLLTLRPGDHVILANDVYGGTYRLLANVLSDWGLMSSTVDLADETALRDAIRPTTKLVWVETPSNPMLKIVDLAAVAAVAHEAGARVVADNTFATPALQRPLEHDADAVVHSVTKYLGGHSDLIGGAIVTSDPEWVDRLGFLTNALGAVPGPMDSFLALRGLKTLAVRMRGGMVSFQVGSDEAALELVTRTKVFFLAESLGGVESLIEVPGPMTHASVAGSPLETPGDLVRLSVGIEHPDDLIADLAHALG